MKKYVWIQRKAKQFPLPQHQRHQGKSRAGGVNVQSLTANRAKQSNLADWNSMFKCKITTNKKNVY